MNSDLANQSPSMCLGGTVALDLYSVQKTDEKFQL